MCRIVPSSPSCCSLCRTCAARSPSSSREDAASAGSSGTPAASPPSYSCLEMKRKRRPLRKPHFHWRPLWVARWVGGKGWLLTPSTHGVLAACHDVFTLLVLPWDHLKLDAGVTHSMVSAGEKRLFILYCRINLDGAITQTDHDSDHPIDLPLKALVKNLIWRE